MGTCSLEATLMALRDAAFDRDQTVRDQIIFSLQDLGKHYPELVLMSCHNYLLKHSQLAGGHRAVILRAMDHIVSDNIRALGRPLARKLIVMASDGLTGSDEAVAGAQEAAMSRLLVTLGSEFIHEILDELTDKLQPGIQPHVSVVRALGDLALGNPTGVAPHLRSILQTLLPMLGVAKREQAKLAFSSTLGAFSRSLLRFHKVSNSGLSPGMRRDEFSHEMSSAYDVLFNHWLQGKDPQLRSSVLETLGPLIRLLSDERLRQELPRLIPGTLALYRRHSEPVYVSRCLRHALEAAAEMGGQTLEVYLEPLLPQLHQQICGPPEPPARSEASLRNQREVLRCFATLARVSPEPLLRFALQKLSQGGERVRIGTLDLIDHLVGQAPAQLEGRRAMLLRGLRPPLQDNDLRVKKVLVRVIGTMAGHGYLELEGGLAMVEFVVRQCSLPWPANANAKAQSPTPTPTPASKAGDEELKAEAERLMERWTSTESMAEVLWPSLLGFLVPARYSNALAGLCSSLETLARRKQESSSPGQFLLDYERRSDLPKPQALLARLLPVCSLPYLGGGRGAAALRFLRVMGPNIHGGVQELWGREISALIQHVSENSPDSLQQQHWENRLLVFLSRTLEVISDERWTRQLSEEMTRGVGSGSGPARPPQEKQFLYKCLGIALQHVASAELVDRCLQEMLLSVQHQEGAEREAVAVAVGFCAMSHLDQTLSKLGDFVRLDLLQKTVHFFNALIEKSDGDSERAKSTLMLCYGYVSLYADESLILPRIEGDILKQVLGLSNTKLLGLKLEARDSLLKLSLIKAVTLIAKAVLGNKHRLSFTFSRRDELLSSMLGLLRSEPKARLRTHVRQSAMIACAYLLRLEPSFNRAYVTELLKTCLDGVLGVQLTGGGEAGSEGASDGEREALYAETSSALQELLHEILVHDMSADGLYSVFKHVEGWLISTKDCERERAAGLASELLGFYLQRAEAGGNREFGHLGSMVGSLVPRCTDPKLSVGEMALDGLYSLFYVQLRCDGLPPGQSDAMVEHLKVVRSQLARADSHGLLRLCSDLGKVISEHLPRDQLGSLLFKLFDGLDDPFAVCCHGTSVVMNTLVRARGASLQARVPEILQALRLRLQWVTGEQIRASVVHFVSILASQNPREVVSCLLLSALPPDGFTGDVWRALAGEAGLAGAVIELLLQKLGQRRLPEEEDTECPPEDGEGCGRSESEPLAVVCALSDMLSNADSAEPVLALYPQLFTSLLLQVSSSLSEQSPKSLLVLPLKASSKDWRFPGQPRPRPSDPCGYSVETLQAMLARAGNQDVVSALSEDGGWALMRRADRHDEGVSLLARAVASRARHQLPGIAQRLSAALDEEGQRNRKVTAAAFLAELLGHPAVSELQLTDSLIAGLSGCLTDPLPAVRLLALRGLGNVAGGEPAKVGPNAVKLLGAMIAGVSEPQDHRNLIALEAMDGLGKVLARLRENEVRGTLVNLILALKPFFEAPEPRARASAFALLGKLSRFAEGEMRSRFSEQAHSTLVSCLLHLNDGSPEVVESCKSCLGLVAPFLGSDAVRAFFQAQLRPQAADWEYWAFLGKLSKLLAVNFPDRVQVYLSGSVRFFKSTLPEVRGNAISLAGLLFQNLPKKSLQTVTSENICVDIISMLHDPVPSVRVRAAQTLSLLY